MCDTVTSLLRTPLTRIGKKMNSKTIFVILFVSSIICCFSVVNAQVNSGFAAPAYGCLNEQISIKNTSALASRYVWDFCSNDLQDNAPLVSSITTLPTSGSFYYNSIKLLNINGQYLCFATDASGNKLLRLNFGADLSSTPQVDNLGNPGGLLVSPGAIDAVNENGIWYFFIVNIFQNKVIRITMGNGLTSDPTLSEDLGIAGLSTPIGIKAVISGSQHLLFVSNLSSQVVSVFDFNNSFASSITATHNLSSPILADPCGIDIVTDGVKWYGLVSSFGGSGHAVLLNFSTDLNNTPTFSDLGIVPSGRQTRIVKEGLNFIGFIRAENDGVYRIQFGSDFSSPPAFTRIASSALQFTSRSLDIIKDTPTWKLFTLEATTGKVLRLDFSGNCQAQVSANYSTQVLPSNISYSQPGNYSIELTAFDANNISSVSSSAIDISNFLAPDLDFSSDNICVSNDINFLSINKSGNLIAYNWDFGDGGNSSTANPAHIFSSIGSYNVSLTVTDINGCHNNAQKAKQIFTIPQANFVLPSANPFCTGQNYVFTNTSSSDPGSNPTWQWSVNGTNVSTAQDLNYLFNTNSNQAVMLAASIPGCSTQTTQTVTAIQNGPLLSFTSSGTSCVGMVVSFSNTSSGSVLGYNWTFGDGNSSSQTSPENAYASNGIYNVTLSASNAAGCQNSFSKPITVYSNPQPDFSLDLPPFSCAGTASQFNDLTPALADSNLSNWSWQFGDAANGTSLQRNPAYTYSTAANYTVNLQVTSNFGCSGSTQKTITIAPSPQAAFINSAACVNQSTQFTDVSTGGIKSRQWKIQNSLFSSSAPTYTFSSPNTYPVTLAVTGNNNCISQITQNVIVPVAPVMDFSVLYPCSGSSSQFQETNPGGSDPATAWNWNFSSGSASGNPANYSFSSSGIYSVTLTSTRQSKCVYSFTKNVSITNGPVAAFIPSTTAGAAPLNVLFSNNSSSANSYSWSFNDANNSSSTDASPSFTFTQLGDYQVKLTASNALNCTSTATATISVVIPNIDASMSSLVLAEDPQTTSTRAIVTITNNSNVPLVDPIVTVDLGGNASLKERVSGSIPVGGSLTKTLSLQIVPTLLQYVCAEVAVSNDVFADNNEQCVSLSQDEITLSPYPNPANTQLNIRWINPKAENVHVAVFKSNGQVAFDEELDSPAGLSEFRVNTSTWASGLYLVRVTAGASQNVYKVVITN
jgi:PKD repeat protein